MVGATSLIPGVEVVFIFILTSARDASYPLEPTIFVGKFRRFASYILGPAWILLVSCVFV